jgi:hypothetical protein
LIRKYVEVLENDEFPANDDLSSLLEDVVDLLTDVIPNDDLPAFALLCRENLRFVLVADLYVAKLELLSGSASTRAFNLTVHSAVIEKVHDFV